MILCYVSGTGNYYVWYEYVVRVYLVDCLNGNAIGNALWRPVMSILRLLTSQFSVCCWGIHDIVSMVDYNFRVTSCILLAGEWFRFVEGCECVCVSFVLIFVYLGKPFWRYLVWKTGSEFDNQDYFFPAMELFRILPQLSFHSLEIFSSTGLFC